ncbi:hypothetical protein AB0K24_54295, partial [Streptomyces mirabilis]
MKPPSRPGAVLLTDYAWPDDSVERSVIEEAGHTLVTGPADPASAEEIEELVAEHRPAGAVLLPPRFAGDLADARDAS